MAHIPGLNYAPTKTKSKQASKADGRQCQVMEVNPAAARCLVSFTLKGSQQRAVLPMDRLFSNDGPCGNLRPPYVGEKLFCDMTPVNNTAANAQWLVAFAWRGKLDSAPRTGPLSAVTGMVSEVGPDSGVLLFVTSAGCRERCAFGRSAIQPDGALLPVGEPLSRHLTAGETALFDCRPTTAAANCHWIADKVWVPSDGYDDEEEQTELPGGESGSGFILRVTLKAVLGRVDLVQYNKAVLTFENSGQWHRALLVTKKYTFSEKATAAERKDLTKVLSKGDQVVFTCHEYDKPDGSDRCGWWVMEAVKLETEAATGSREAGYFQNGHLYEKIGTVKEVLAAEGLLHFVLDKRREVAWFSSNEVFINGRPCEGRLSDALEAGQRVHFNAEKSPAPRGADWRCVCVWRGEMPTVEASQKRIQAAVVKSQKKPKSGKSSIDDLDDFEVPAAPASGRGEGWPGAATTVRVPPASPRHPARPHLGDGDRGGRTARQPQRLRASMADALDDFDTSVGGGNGSLSGEVRLDWAQGVPEAAADWAEEGGASWDEEPPTAGDPAGTASSGPSRPLSDASLEPTLSPSRAQQSPPADPSRPPLLPLLEHSVPLPDPNLPRPPLPADPRAWSAAGYTHPTETAAAGSRDRRPPPGLSASRQPAGPANPPGLSPGELAAAAAATYRQQQAAAAGGGGSAGLLGEAPVSHGGGLLPTPPAPLAGFYPGLAGYPGQPPYWQPGVMLAHPAQLQHHMLYGVPAPRPRPPLPPQPVMPPLNVDQESLEQMVRGGRLPVSAAPTTASTSQKRSVPAADWEAAAAAFQTNPDPALAPATAPAPAPAPASSESSPTLESIERRQEAADALSERLAAAGLGGGDGSESGLDEPLEGSEEEGDPLGAAGGRQVSPDVEPVSGRGQILAFVDECRGLAEWDREGSIEQVMFDRDVCFWMGERMDTLDLTDCYTPGAEVLFRCVPADPDEPYQWVATHFEQVED